MRKILGYLPRFLRVWLIRRNIRIPEPPKAFQVRVATTKEDLEKAYSLLHDCYVEMKLMAPDPSGLRCNFFSFLPYTTTVVAVVGKKIVGTVSLIKDSSVGLPSDKNYKEENDLLRQKGAMLVEVSALAIDPDFRQSGHTISLNLMKYLQHYCTHLMGCDTVTAVVHPRARDFYLAFWNFKSSEKIVEYKFVNGALGAHVYGPITDDKVHSLVSWFPKSENKNPMKFLMKQIDFLQYPKRNIEHHLDPIYTPELLKYFMSERTNAIKSLSSFELLTIYSAYSLFFEKALNKIDIFKEVGFLGRKKRHFRFPSEISAKLVGRDEVPIFGRIMDLSPTGAFFSTEHKVDASGSYKLEFDLGRYSFSIDAKIKWQNRRRRANQAIGFGISFSHPQLTIARLLKQTHRALAIKAVK